MKASGGYFELELENKYSYHADALKLNCGRNAFEYVLKANNYRRVYLPYFTCEVMSQQIDRLNIACEYYHINEEFEPIFEYGEMSNNEAFVYTNYFGLKDNFIKVLAGKCKNLIIDNAQAFFSKPIKNVDTFYSPRKYFGLPDGAYLFTNKYLDEELEVDKSFSRCEHLLRRLDNGAEDGYPYFLKNENDLNDVPLRKMSNLTQSMLKNINYSEIGKLRVRNFNYVHKALGSMNKLKLNPDDIYVPFDYPFYTDKKGLREKLIKEKYFVAQYWPGIIELVTPGSLEFEYVNQIVHIPIDQRFEEEDLAALISIILNE